MLDNRPMLQLSFLTSFVRCEFQCRSSCSMIPKNLTWVEVFLSFLSTSVKIEIFMKNFVLDLLVTSSVSLVFRDLLQSTQ